MSDVGGLALVRFDYTDKSGWKVRPGLITGEYLNDYQVTFITKEVNKYCHEDTSVIIDNDDVSAGKLMKKSLVRTHKTFWIEKAQCKRIGSLKTEVTDKILRLNENYFVRNYYNFAHKQNQPFIPGKSRINYAGRVFDEKEMINLVDSALDFWLTTGKYAECFEREFADFLGIKHALLVTSGSSANLLLSMRDWGRDCWCASGKDNTCGKRFLGQHGSLPYGYDHKYVYSHFGYNLKATDICRRR